MRRFRFTRFACLAPVLLLALSVASPAQVGGRGGGGITYWPTGGNDPQSMIRRGEYDAAIRALMAIPRSDAGWLDAQKNLMIAYGFVGKYDDAERVARTAMNAPEGAWVANTLGEILMVRGKRAEAESAFVRSMRGGAPDSLTAKLNLAVLRYERGEHAAALAEFDSFIDVYNNFLPALTSDQLSAVGVAVTYLGVKDPQLFKDALRAFDRAISVDPENVDAKVLLAELFLEKYNGADAQATFEDVLRQNDSHPRALVGAAHRLAFDNRPGGDSLIRRALQINPSFVPARLALAAQFIDIEDYRAAQAELDQALRVDPASAEALAGSAVIKLLSGDRAAYDQLRQRALQLNPRNGDFFVTMAEASGRVRLYAQAAELAREAVRVDSTNWRAYGVLGMNLMRLGRIEEGRTNLDIAFAGDPYNVWIKNTLDLLDTFSNYDVIRTPNFEFMIEKSESAILAVYLGDLMEEAHAVFSTRYGYTPPPPVRVEVYRSHADFSVRTVGLAGLGALGVSFGTTLAFDSPAARDAGPFNWGSTVWHELAHTFTLGVTDHKVPRWFSEGLSVHEEHLARPGWGFRATPGFLVAFRDGKLMPVSRLNDGFMRPAFPQMVHYSYIQAALVAELISRDHGQEALAAMLRAYKAGQSTEQVFQSVLRTDIKAFDQKFDAFMKERYAGPLAALRPVDSLAIDAYMPSAEVLRKAAEQSGSYAIQMIAGRLLLDRGEDSVAVIPLERARALFPEYGGADSPYPDLVKIYSSVDQVDKLLPVLQKLIEIGESNYDAHLALATLYELRGDHAAAADALDRAMYINPFDLEVHRRLADLFEKAGDKKKVIRERRAIVALNPVDRAEALYRLALAYESDGDIPNAKKSVLRSLEEAPNFERAQELMLKLHGGDR